MNYEIVGDIHVHADRLIAFSRKLGHHHQIGPSRHPKRGAFFVGDFIDCGPRWLGSTDHKPIFFGHYW